MKSTSCIKKDVKPSTKKNQRGEKNELCDMGLFELSIKALMPDDVYQELKRRIEVMEILLEINKPKKALNIVKSLLTSPQKRLKGAKA